MKSGLPSGSYGPVEYLEHLSEDEKIHRLQEYAKALLIVHGRDGAAIKGQDTVEKLIAAVDNKDPRKTVVGAMRYVLGYKDITATTATDKSFDFAKQSLFLRYFLPKKRGSTEFVPRAILSNEFEKAVMNRNITDVQMRNPKLIADALPPGHFKGLLKLGVDPNGDKIEEALQEQIELQHKRLADRAAQVADSRRLAGEIDEEIKNKAEREGKTVSEVWDDMNGWEKVALIAAAAYIAAKQQGIALGVGAIYFGRRFLMDDDAPFDSMGRMLSKAFNSVKDATDNVLSKVGFESPKAANAYVDLMVTYMDTEVRERMEQGVIGFSLLANAPMDQLASAFDPAKGGPDGSIQIVDGGKWDKNSPLYAYIQGEIAEGRLNEKKALEFFSDAENQRQVCDALSHVFYAIGADIVKNKERKRFVENAASALAPHDSYDALESDAKKKYLQLMQAGRGAAGSESLAGRIRMYVKGNEIEEIEEEILQEEGVKEMKPAPNAYDADPQPKVSDGKTSARSTNSVNRSNSSDDLSSVGRVDDSNSQANDTASVSSDFAEDLQSANKDNSESSANLSDSSVKKDESNSKLKANQAEESVDSESNSYVSDKSANETLDTNVVSETEDSVTSVDENKNTVDDSQDSYTEDDSQSNDATKSQSDAGGSTEKKEK